MHQAQLISGEINSFIPIGIDGRPVYQNAEAFRDAIARSAQLGPRCARFLALPRFNGALSQATWLVPFAPTRPDGQYRIISWQTATAEEKQQALAQLDQFEQALMQEGQKLLALSPEGDRLLFAHYLTGVTEAQRLPAVHFPGPEYLFIVDGQPVITFWGFLKAGDRLSVSPFDCLRPASPVGVAPQVAAGSGAAAASVATADSKRGHHCVLPLWLRWLLLALLLLLLLYFLLWWLLPLLGIRLPWLNFDLPGFRIPGLNLNGGDVTISAPDPGFKGDTALNLTSGDKTQVVYAGDQHTVVVPGEEPVVTETAVNTQEVPAAEGTPVAPDSEKLVSPAPNEENVVPQEPNAPALEPETGSESPTATPSAENTSQESPATVNSAPLPPTLSSTSSDAKPLRLDAKALARGDVSALEGQWQTRSGMMDVNTGRPLNLSYSYHAGKGQLVVTRQDGTRCVVAANPQAVNGVLQINAQGHAICPDNTTYALPQIKCQPRADGSADCAATYGNAQPFPLRVYSSQQGQ
ncbi:MAG: hypothetical protein IAA31_08590 [Candidatus Anaerobiospirillum merdipullorum]|uniref:Virulence factor n=1 Tax=Candidatus Anaerobiospirillum merdipullorum TaxID=2838450 RepID=A0A9E2NUL0_9GAMM|nr:hypothetical protein [Candidatus Anaerobiospirillum merdipullorum]